MQRPGYLNQQPQIILLREGTDASQGKGQLLTNISACLAVVDTIRTTLGPRGMDKLIVDSNGRVTISNDGATIMKLLDVVQPAARSLVDIARAQDAEVGDGTTSVVIMTGEILRQVKQFVEDGVAPRTIIKGIRQASQLCKTKINELKIDIGKQSEQNPALWRDTLEKCASTSMSSKLIHSQEEFFKKLVVDAVLSLDEDLNEKMIGMKIVKGGALQDSLLVKGVAFKKSFSYAGFEQQPKKFTNPKVLCLNVELELKAEKDNAEVRVDKVQDYQSVVDAEWKIIYDKLDNITQSNAKVVLSKLPIGDLATQYFADRGIFCAGRVADDDMRRVCAAVGATMQSTVSSIPESALGECEKFEERQIGGERFNFFTGCASTKSCTIIMRGGAEQFIQEVERSLHDAIMVVRRVIKHRYIVAGGGAIQMELSKFLKDYANSIQGKVQLIILAVAKAFEVIPRQLCENAGIDSISILNQLRQKHAQGFAWAGVDVNAGEVVDSYNAFVWEPSMVVSNLVSSAAEAACLILSVDETVKNPQSEQAQQAQRGGAAMRGGRGGMMMPGR